MKEMSQKLQSSIQQSESEQCLGRYGHIATNFRKPYHTFSRSRTLAQYRETNINSPQYTNYMQLQKKLQNDAQIVEDSLFALSKDNKLNL